MNERIKALLLNDRSMFINGVTESNDKIYIHGSEENLVKFAELIVQEMIGLLEQYSRDSFPEDIMGDFDKGYQGGLYTAQKAVKDHFGVNK